MRDRHVLFCAAALLLLVFASADKTRSHKLVKRQLRASAQRSFPLSRSRQYPAPEELEEEISEEERSSEEEPPPPPARRYSYQFQEHPQPPDESEDAIGDYTYTEAPPTTTTTTKSPTRISTFNRPTNRPRFGTTTSQRHTPATTKPPSNSRSRLTSAPAQRIDVTADILNRPPPPRPSSARGNTAPKNASERKPLLEETSSNAPANRRSSNGGRTRARGRLRTRTSTTTTTTTTTTAAPESEEYYYYYYDDEEETKQPLATTSTTTTTTTTPKPFLPRRPSLNKNRGTTTKATPQSRVKFDQDLQFQPPPDDAVEIQETSRATKRFTTSTTEVPPPGGIPPHLRDKYKERTDGRFVDYLRDPNRPRELKGFDLSEYPFYIRVPDDIVFDCEDKKDGYYASVPHHCQLFHYCFAGSRYDFLCANYTLYDQTTFTCRFANNVDCASSEKFYYRNDDLWKETPTLAPKKATVAAKDEDYEEEEYDDDEYYYDDDEEDDKRRRRPYRRRRNRRRKNRRKQAAEKLEA